MNDSLSKGVITTILYALVMSISGVVVKLSQNDISLGMLLFWQSAICLVFVLPQQRGHWHMPTLPILGIHLVRSLGGFVGFYCYYIALQHIPLVEAALLRTSAPLWVPLVILIIHQIGIPAHRWLPLLLGFAGVACIIKPSVGHISPWHIVGLTSAIGLAFSMVTTRLLSHKVRAQETLFMYFFISMLLGLFLALVNGESFLLPIKTIPYILAIGVSLYVGMHLYTLAYSYAPASVVSPISFVSVVFSGFWGWLIWHHQPDLMSYLGILLIFASIIVIALTRKR